MSELPLDQSALTVGNKQYICWFTQAICGRHGVERYRAARLVDRDVEALANHRPKGAPCLTSHQNSHRVACQDPGRSVACLNAHTILLRVIVR